MNSKNLFKITICCLAVLFFACSQKTTNSSSYFLSPETGRIVKSGDSVKLDVSFADPSVDSVQYFVDSAKVKTITDTNSVSISTEKLALGSRLIGAKIYSKTGVEEITGNIVLVSSKIPAQYGYKIIKTFPHSTTSYTEGLEYQNGIFYESAGDYGNSSLRKVALDGEILKQQNIEKQYFAEGITVIGDKIIQLTYKEKIGFEYDKNTFKLLKTFPYNHADEGWGLCFNGETIYNTDGTNRIFKLNKSTYLPEGYLEVYDDKGPVTQLNELEWIDGKLYANIYQSELLAIINPQSGEVEAYINLIGLPHGPLGDPGNDVLNGIAYDSVGKKLFVTGKKWDKLFQIEIVKN
jgi:glutaminyl-peptide cyclotransferase